MCSTAVSAAISTRLTASHPNSEVKLVRAGVVLRWGTTREGPVLRFSFVLRKVLLRFYLSFLAHLAPAGLFGGVAGLRDARRGSRKDSGVLFIRRAYGRDVDPKAAKTAKIRVNP